MPFPVMKGLIAMQGARLLRLGTTVVLIISSVLILTACEATGESEPSGENEPDRVDGSVQDNASDEGFQVSITRSDGVELTLDSVPERIVSMSPGATETLFEIGAGDQLVAADMFSNYPAEALELEQIDAYQPDPEVILGLDADLVVVIYDADGIVSVLDDLGVPVLYLEAPVTIEGLIEQTGLLGEVTGNPDQAENVASSLADRVDAIESRIDSVEHTLSVYHELDESFFTVGPESFIGDVYQTLNVRNIAEAAQGDYPQLSEEIILEEDPDVIVIPVQGEPDGSAADGVMSRPGWDVVAAVENERVFEIDGDIISRPGPRIVDALEQLAEMLYPEEFVSGDDISTTPGYLRDAA